MEVASCVRRTFVAGATMSPAGTSGSTPGWTGAGTENAPSTKTVRLTGRAAVLNARAEARAMEAIFGKLTAESSSDTQHAEGTFPAKIVKGLAAAALVHAPGRRHAPFRNLALPKQVADFASSSFLGLEFAQTETTRTPWPIIM